LGLDGLEIQARRPEAAFDVSEVLEDQNIYHTYDYFVVLSDGDVQGLNGWDLPNLSDRNLSASLVARISLLALFIVRL
jgi:hypothetical protein